MYVDCGWAACSVKTRSGVRVSGVENQDASRWRLSVDLNQKRQTSTVTAYSLQLNSSGAIDRCALTILSSLHVNKPSSVHAHSTRNT